MEYRTIATTVEEMEVVKDLLKELGMANNSPVTLFSDSQAVVFVANNPLFKASSHYYGFAFLTLRNGERSLTGKTHRRITPKSKFA